MPGRNVIANITLTLDGHTTGSGGAFDMSCIAPHGMSDEARDALGRMTSATTALLGRTNYEGFGSWWPAVAQNPDAEPRDRQFAQWLDAVDKVVFSTRKLETSWQHSRLAEQGPVETVRRLREDGTGDIRVLNSQSVIRQLLEAGEIDRLEVTLAPEVVGGGDRLFRDGEPPSRWTLSRSQATGSGAVLLTYDRAGLTGATA